MLINDDREPAAGTLVLGIETREGISLATRETPFRLAGLGREVYRLALPVPQDHGKYLLKATARPQGTRHKSPTVCRRKLSVEPLPPPLERTEVTSGVRTGRGRGEARSTLGPDACGQRRRSWRRGERLPKSTPSRRSWWITDVGRGG